MHITLHRLSLRLHKPFRVSSWTIAARDIVILQIADPGTGLSGYGEAAPLQAFGTESLDECLSALEMFAREYSRSGLDAESLAGERLRIFNAMQGAPTARCAVETAMLDLLAREKRMTLAGLLGAVSGSARIPVNAIVGGGTIEETLRSAGRAVENGFTCLKLKVGAGTPDEDVERVAAVRALVGQHILIRLDANGAWDLPTAQEMLRRLAASDIEYIEQPVKSIQDLAVLKRQATIPIAADESAQLPAEAERIIREAAADVLVLKPMTAGGPLAAMRLAEMALSAGIDVVFTSFIDSSVGRHAVAQLCAAMPQLTRHHGIATGALFLDDTGRDEIFDGYFHLSNEPGIGMIPDLDGEHASA